MNDLHTLWLPISLSALAALLLLVDVVAPVGGGRRVGVVAILGLVGLLVATFFVDGSGRAAFGAYEGGPWTTFFQRLFLAAGVLGALAGLDDVAKHTPRRQGEHWLVLVVSLVGMSLLPGARDLVLLVVAFEVMGVPLYVLAAYAKTDAVRDAVAASGAPRSKAAEGALKLYLVGVTSSAVTLFGLALLTGMTGTSRLDAIGAATMSPLASVGLVFVLGGLGYKIGMVPFHMWVPDTYQGSQVPFVAFLSVAPKAAGISVLSTIFLYGLGAHRATWMPPLALMALLSMAIGNFLALVQTDLRRLLGYSGIAQMGYVLLAVAASDAYGAGMTLFFLTAYLFTNLGIFLVVHATGARGFGFEALSGLSRRSPGLAAALLCFLLSLAGIPFVVGFWAKLYVFLAAWRAGMVGLVVAGIVLAVIGLFYYLRMLRAAYMTDDGDVTAPATTPSLRLAIGICLAMVIGLGLWPGPLVDDAMRASRDLFAATHTHREAARQSAK